MEVTWQVRNLVPPDYLKDTVEKKLQRLGKKIPFITDVHIELTKEKTRSREQQVVTEVTLRGTNNILLRAEERTADPLTGIDAALHALDGRVKHLKSKLYRSEAASRTARTTRLQSRLVAEAEIPQDDDASPDGVVRVKRFVMRPMSVEDAVLQMESLGHAFFFFENAATSEHAVVYRRRDGKYGLMEPAR